MKERWISGDLTQMVNCLAVLLLIIMIDNKLSLKKLVLCNIIYYVHVNVNNSINHMPRECTTSLKSCRLLMKSDFLRKKCFTYKIIFEISEILRQCFLNYII